MNRKVKDDQRIEECVAFISRHFNETIHVGQLAHKINLSSSYFWALFKQKTGYPPLDFLIRLRMQRACQLLNSTNLKVKKIAEAVGYKDSLYFSRLFKSVCGVAPTDYRAANSSAVPAFPQMNGETPPDSNAVSGRMMAGPPSERPMVQEIT